MMSIRIAATDMRRQMSHMANETATVRQIAMEVQLIGGEMQQAKAAAVVLASKLTFFDLGG